ncbi:ABC transporter permease [Lentzea tibetensis]|uniref:Transport permease protein n=1 Tax=Lentzea tibetensis TaxID=2591470 RepID=A0A563F3D8_9PSEU|nr:ABC transporter permease [Lentzea tibetensis]TWP54278.1 ABC transporter permease [Lentzea tibetensis]
MIATALRVANQLRRDPGTLALLLVVPAVLMTLFRYLFSEFLFTLVGPSMLGVFPFIVMFAVTAVTMLRERTAGTLERLLAMPMRKVDLLLGYALTFGVIATVQSGVLIAWSVFLGLDAPSGLLVLVAVLDGVLGMALGLFVSVFARTEFQVGQMMPAFVLPQLLLSGVFGPREEMADVLRWISDALPMTYAVDASSRLVRDEGLSGEVVRDLVVLGGATLLALVLGAATLRRQTR